MSNEPCPHAVAAIEINTFGADGVRTAQVFTNGDADFRIAGREFSIDVKRAQTPAFVERAERAAVNAHAQAMRAETQANIAQAGAVTAKNVAAELAAKAKPARKPTRRKR